MIDPLRRRVILALALPIIGGMVSQNILNLVDTAMVGALGATAIAAVGIGGFANFVAIAFITGLSASVQAIAARRMGEGAFERTAVSLNGGMLMALIIGIPASALLYQLAPWFSQYLSNDAELVAMTEPYLQWRVLSFVAVGVNFAFRGYFNAVSLSRLYMQTLIVMHAANILLNWVLIFGHLGAPAMGAQGAALASTLSLYIGSIQYLMLGFRRARGNGFLRGLPDADTVWSMIRLLVPNGLQSFMFALGFLMLYWIVGRVGTEELAATTVLINLSLVAILPGLAFGMAAATLVGQALGRKDAADAKRWGWEVVVMAMAVVGTISLAGLLFTRPILAIFLTDASTLELAVLPLRIAAASMAIECIAAVLLNAHAGAGDTRRAMVVSIGIQWGLALPLIYAVGIWLGWGLLGIWSIHVGSRCLQSLVFVVLWQREKWAQIEL